MIKNRELALIPDSALELVDPPTTAPVPGPRPSTSRRTRDAPTRRRAGRAERARREVG